MMPFYNLPDHSRDLVLAQWESKNLVCEKFDPQPKKKKHKDQSILVSLLS